jgi:hypothetical protein
VPEQQRCPFDPSGMHDLPFPDLTCPACGCVIYTGLVHPPCTDPVCSFYDEEIATRKRHPAYRQRSGAIFVSGNRGDAGPPLGSVHAKD